MVFEEGMPVPDRYASQLSSVSKCGLSWHGACGSCTSSLQVQKSSSPVDLKHLSVIKVAVLNAAVVINVSGKNSGS